MMKSSVFKLPSLAIQLPFVYRTMVCERKRILQENVLHLAVEGLLKTDFLLRLNSRIEELQ